MQVERALALVLLRHWGLPPTTTSPFNLVFGETIISLHHYDNGVQCLFSWQDPALATEHRESFKKFLFHLSSSCLLGGGKLCRLQTIVVSQDPRRVPSYQWQLHRFQVFSCELSGFMAILVPRLSACDGDPLACGKCCKQRALNLFLLERLLARLRQRRLKAYPFR
jgi:hypothetical protein